MTREETRNKTLTELQEKFKEIKWIKFTPSEWEGGIDVLIPEINWYYRDKIPAITDKQKIAIKSLRFVKVYSKLNIDFITKYAASIIIQMANSYPRQYFNVKKLEQWETVTE